jgi:hypothetical protein
MICAYEPTLRRSQCHYAAALVCEDNDGKGEARAPEDAAPGPVVGLG